MKIVAKSHVDHGLTGAQVSYLQHLYSGRDEFFIETVELPPNLGTVPCGLHGPLVGDAPIAEAECHFAKRGDRDGDSRLCNRAPRQVRTVTVIAGPLDSDSCALYTAFGGPLAKKEPWDPSLEGDALEESKAFWAEHALSA